MRQIIFKDTSKLIEYLKQPKKRDFVDSIRIKVKGCREVNHWIRISDVEKVGDSLCIYEEQHLAATVKYIYPFSQLETVKVARHHKREMPRIIYKLNGIQEDSIINLNEGNRYKTALLY